MALPILYMVGSMVVRAAAPAIMRQLATLGAKKLGKKAVETIILMIELHHIDTQKDKTMEMVLFKN